MGLPHVKTLASSFHSLCSSPLILSWKKPFQKRYKASKTKQLLNYNALQKLLPPCVEIDSRACSTICRKSLSSLVKWGKERDMRDQKPISS